MSETKGESIELADVEDKQTDEEMKEDVDRIVEERRDTFTKEEKAEISTLQKNVDRASSKITFTLDEEIQVDQEDSKRSTTTRNRKIYIENDDLEESAKRSEKEHEDIGDSERKGRFFTRFKFLSWALAITIATTGLAISIYNLAAGKDDKNDGLTDDDRKRIKDQVEAWRKLSETDFWNSMADFVDTWHPSLQAQMLFMEYTKDLSQEADWPDGSASTVNGLKMQLENAFTSSTVPLDSRTTSMIFRLVPTFTMVFPPGKDPVGLPRYLAADLCDLALADIIHFLRLQKGEA